MSRLEELRAKCSMVALNGDKLKLRGADVHAQAFAKEHKEEILRELRVERDQNGMPWPAGRTPRQMRELCMGLESRLLSEVVAPGDVADRALELIRGWLAALQDHELHGRNWWRLYGRELSSYVRQALPIWFVDVQLEGDELHAALRRAFPSALTIVGINAYSRKNPGPTETEVAADLQNILQDLLFAEEAAA